ncbi:glycine-rich domain-containing protein [Chryseobacterium sp. Leaf201]|uniref:glycine-rich domain-containing protein n=1 Tax=Chryseobacterium sp. Leaf201 TaxID=1735672 RepID=UPI0006F1DABF|nr:hypothetical protein [Chryseobacterium sp. Leaf201]KQM62886.1 hypothetical protein ASE55_00410 [Chryseobacterium sp. Leaf201]
METKIIVQDRNLWNRIREFSPDAPGADLPFSKKLALEENWTESFTRKAVEEYKKFVYLCCIVPGGASPSRVIDKVWHMHLIYTRNYWEEFCPNVLQQKLHHHPSNGGRNEKAKHETWFSETLKNYGEVFHQQAPEDIWTDKKEQKKYKKPGLQNIKMVSLLSVIFMLSSCSDVVYSISALFIVIPVLFIAGAFLNRNNNPKDRNNNGGGSSCGNGGDAGSSGCSNSCGNSCGSGCGGCGGGGD